MFAPRILNNTGLKRVARRALNDTRKYWHSSESANSQAHQALISMNSDSEENGLVSRSGDNSPIMNPLLIIGTNKRPIFPGYLSSVFVKDENLINALVENKEKDGGYVGVFLRKDDVVDFPELITDESQIHKVGGFAQIQTVNRTEQGMQLILMGHRRITLDAVTSYKPLALANVTHWKKAITEKTSTVHEKAYKHEIMSTVRELVRYNPLLQEMLTQWVSRIDFNDPSKLSDFATALTSADGEDLQKVLEAREVEERLSLVLELLTREKELVKLQREISKQVEEKVNKSQREYFLREQLKSIKKELGMEKDDKEDLIDKYQTKLDGFTARGVKEETVRAMADELKKLSTLDKASAEFNVSRAYLDWLVAMPWGLHTKDMLQLSRAKTVLDEDHYGLDEVKKRILEFIAVGKLKGEVTGKILCFVGPPGVGKTSIAKSIARSLDRKYYRFSVGGLTDTAEIKGHRRTYVGAMPGKPVQCLKTTECLNPLILIDEIDKVGRGHNGDPSSALLELLDPNQNESFVDHYLDIPMDFSSVLFVCTANDEGAIPAALRDRMEMIRLTGYDLNEKVAIASRYLVPKCFHDAGLSVVGDKRDNGATAVTAMPPTVQYEITDAALETLVKNYCRESGVRSLEKMIERVARKLAFAQVTEAEVDTPAADISAAAAEETAKPKKAPKMTKKAAAAAAAAEAERLAAAALIPPRIVTVTVDNLEQFAGKPVFTTDTIYESSTGGVSDGVLPIGVVMGLAWDPMGGCPIFVETAATPTAYSDNGGGVHTVTGQLGSVMKESVSIAYTFARQFVSKQDKESKFFNSHQLHVHVPEGAVQKDGPSAGVSMTTSMISMATGTPVRPRLAMTGELSLTGKVLPVGGIKEKSLAARRSGATAIILPAANRRDFEELPVYVKEHLEVHYASEYRDVYKLAFPEGTPLTPPSVPIAGIAGSSLPIVNA